MRTADLDTTTLYAYAQSFGGTIPVRVLAVAQWFKFERYNAPSIYAPHDSIPAPNYSRPYNGGRKGIPVIGLTSPRTHREDDELITRAYEVVRRLFSGYVHADIGEARDALIEALGEDDAKKVRLALARPQDISGTWTAFVERETAEREARRKRLEAEARAEAQNAEERDLAYVAVRELIGEDAEMPVRSVRDRGESLSRVSMEWTTLSRLIAEARAAGQADAAKALADAEHGQGFEVDTAT